MNDGKFDEENITDLNNIQILREMTKQLEKTFENRTYDFDGGNDDISNSMTQFQLAILKAAGLSSPGELNEHFVFTITQKSQHEASIRIAPKTEMAKEFLARMGAQNEV